ncbi:MAG: hypothetical protein LQ349_006371 [Xanthoria aureola]|nr:MAG: hypothetical protein LQ349_006371 [Xanthoria aureola]
MDMVMPTATSWQLLKKASVILVLWKEMSIPMPSQIKTTKASSSPNRSARKYSRGFSKNDEEASTAKNSTSPISTRKSIGSYRHHRHTSGSRSRFASADDIHIHPASFRNEIIQASRLKDIESNTSEAEDEDEVLVDGEPATEDEPLLGPRKSNGSAKPDLGGSHQPRSYDHADHKHSQPQEESKGGHSHGDLNMRGVFLHVMGDALGNIGVIGSALIIWLTSWSWRYYADPAISLLITVIILGSAIPLCQAASRILLQAVPPGISVDDIQADIQDLPGNSASTAPIGILQVTTRKTKGTALAVRLMPIRDPEGPAKGAVERQAYAVSLMPAS